MKKFISIIFICSIIINILSGCDSDKEKTIGISYNNIISIENSQTIDVNKVDKQLYVPFVIRESMSFTPEFENIKNDNIFYVVRSAKDKIYTISKLSDGTYLFLLFGEIDSGSEKKQILLDGFKADSLIDEESFSMVKIGISKTKVLELDANAYDDEVNTIHRLSDLTVKLVKYKENSNNELIVSEIIELDTENSVISYLLPQDRALLFEKTSKIY